MGTHTCSVYSNLMYCMCVYDGNHCAWKCGIVPSYALCVQYMTIWSKGGSGGQWCLGSQLTIVYGNFSSSEV